MIPKKYERLRERVQKTEEQLKSIIEDGGWGKMLLYGSQKKRERIKKLIGQRKYLLDRMFVATPEEVARMEQLNASLFDLTKMLYARTEELYRKMATTSYNPDFDDDVDVEGTLRFSMDGPDSLLPMSNDDYYGSDFAMVLEIVDYLFYYKMLGKDDIEFAYCYHHPSKYSPDMSSEDLGVIDELNDGRSWYEACQPAADKFSHICICYAIHELSMNMPYSIPDILRMNDFWTEVSVKHQHFSTKL